MELVGIDDGMAEHGGTADDPDGVAGVVSSEDIQSGDRSEPRSKLRVRARQDIVVATVEGSAELVVGGAAHEDDPRHGALTEVSDVSGKGPWDPLVGSEAPLGIDGGDEADHRVVTSPPGPPPSDGRRPGRSGTPAILARHLAPSGCRLPTDGCRPREGTGSGSLRLDRTRLTLQPAGAT